MTSARQVAANRLNGSKSRGPRTKAGKARASQNAFRHGFASVSYRNPDFRLETARIVKSLYSKDDNPLLVEQAHVIAETEILLRGIRAEKVAAIERMRELDASPIVKRDRGLMRARARSRRGRVAWAEFVRLKAKIKSLSRSEREKMVQEVALQPRRDPLIPMRDETAAMRAATPDLNRLGRYERRAWARLRLAILRFMSLKFAGGRPVVSVG
jgi:hypothetical protein